MNTKTIGFIGSGRVTRIMLGGWKKAGRNLDNVVVSDPGANTLNALKILFQEIAIAPGDNRLAAGRDIVFLALHPPAMGAVLTEIRDAVPPGALVVSLAPKFTTARLVEGLGGHPAVARVIPNAPSIIGAGYNPVAFAAGVSASAKSDLLALLAPLGESPEVDESKLEAYAILTGMGPTYFWFQWQELLDLVQGMGLTPAEAAPAMKRMVCGAARTLLDSGMSPEAVMNLVPVKPLADDESVIRAAYQSRLPALFARIKP